MIRHGLFLSALFLSALFLGLGRAREVVRVYGPWPARQTCTVYPGGVVDSFTSTSTLLDLACTHVLAADLVRGWYIYGEFDHFQGQPSLQSMVFYVGGVAWRVQRGWIFNMDGSPVKQAGAKQDIPGTNCAINLVNRHVKVGCPEFIALYDGIMSGHISRIPPTMDKTEIGLCFERQLSFWQFQNWQLPGQGACQLDMAREPCGEDSPSCLRYSEPASESEEMWQGCGGGAVLSCGEVGCAGSEKLQRCVVDQAQAMACGLVRGVDYMDVRGESCPEEECEWFRALLGESFSCGEE